MTTFNDLPGAPFASRHFNPFAGQDIRTLIQAQARLRADHPYLVWRPFEGPRKAWTYAQFAQTVARFAAGLHARGIREGDRVLVHLDNCPEAIIAWFGCAWMGAVAVTTNARSVQGAEMVGDHHDRQRRRPGRIPPVGGAIV
ncbi:MAG: AMP-binding protein [Burkholderiales bacterium]|nr:AMP-binding protein [Burkholderiales bacterium]